MKEPPLEEAETAPPTRPEENQPTVRTDRVGGPPPETAARAKAAVRPIENRSVQLRPDQVIASRYRIIRFIAKGGMGEVYEAEDLQLQERIALKTVRADVSEDPSALERFRREIQIARKATHLNLCRIFDLGLEGGPVEEGGLMFLTMELLDGETISQRIKRAGAFSVDEAKPLLAQIASGLDALHAAGIVHRDFKPGNVLLVPGADEQIPMRAVITDFGLARPVVSTESLQTISAPGMVMGTPAYMAPEQVRGEKVTTSADIYAFGVVAYEMLTGRLPFTATSSWALAAKRLTDPPTPPSEHVEGLKGSCEAAILRCLSRESEKRFSRARHFVAALDRDDGATTAFTDGERTLPRVTVDPSHAEAASGLSAAASSTRFRRIGVPAAVVALVGVGAALGVWQLQKTEPATVAPPAAPAVVVRRAVAVAPASGASDAATSWGVQAALSGFLEAGHALRLARSTSGDRLLGRLTTSGAGDAELRAAARGELSADVLAVPAWSTSGGLGRVSIRLLDIGSGSVLAEVAATGSPDDLVGLLGRAAADLRKPLGLPPLTASEEVAVRSWFPGTPEARKSWAAGFASLKGDRPREAAALLEKAEKADPKSPAIPVALADAYRQMGYAEKAAAAARRAAKAAEGADADTRRHLEARAAELARDQPTAIAALARQLEARPDDLDTGVRLATAQLEAGLANDALVTLERLRRLPAPLGRYPRLDLTEAYARGALGDGARMMAAAERAVAASQKAGSGSVLAEALVARGMAASSLGDPARAIASIDEARKIFESLGDAQGVTLCLEQSAEAVLRKGDAAGAERLLREALARYRHSGDLLGQARALQNTGTALLEQGKGPEAARLYDESLKAFRAAGARKQAADALNSLGVRLHLEGELTLARRRYQDALALYQELGDEAGTAQALTNHGETLALSGDLKTARTAYDEALALYRKSGDRASAAYVTFRTGELLLVQGDLAPAEERLEEARKAFSEAGDKLGVVDVRLTRTRLLLAQGKAPDAETEARAVEQIARAEGAADRVVTAFALLGEALLSQNRGREAIDAAQTALERSKEGTSALYRFEAEVSLARVTVGAGSAEEKAAAGLRAAELVKTLSGKGLAVLALEARTVAASAALGGPGAAKGVADLRAVVAEARGKGLGLVARGAEKALGTSSTGS